MLAVAALNIGTHFKDDDYGVEEKHQMLLEQCTRRVVRELRKEVSGAGNMLPLLFELSSLENLKGISCVQGCLVSSAPIIIKVAQHIAIVRERHAAECDGPPSASHGLTGSPSGATATDCSAYKYMQTICMLVLHDCLEGSDSRQKGNIGVKSTLPQAAAVLRTALMQQCPPAAAPWPLASTEGFPNGECVQARCMLCCQGSSLWHAVYTTPKHGYYHEEPGLW